MYEYMNTLACRALLRGQEDFEQRLLTDLELTLEHIVGANRSIGSLMPDATQAKQPVQFPPIEQKPTRRESPKPANDIPPASNKPPEPQPNEGRDTPESRSKRNGAGSVRPTGSRASGNRSVGGVSYNSLHKNTTETKSQKCRIPPVMSDDVLRIQVQWMGSWVFPRV